MFENLSNRQSIVLWIVSSVVVITLFMYGLLIIPQNVVNLRTSDMTDSTHTFKMYNSLLDAMLDNDAVASVTIELENGNYIGNPSTLGFKGWLIMCTTDRDNFSYERYCSIFLK